MVDFFARVHRRVATAMIIAFAAAAPLPCAAQESPDPGNDNREGAGGGATGGTSDSGETRQDCYKNTLANFIYCWEQRSPAERSSSTDDLLPWQQRP